MTHIVHVVNSLVLAQSLGALEPADWLLGNAQVSKVHHVRLGGLLLDQLVLVIERLDVDVFLK